MFIEKLRGRPGASPLFTHYDETSGSRVELSGTTFANWVDKTVNMLDDLGVEAGEPVHLDLVNTDPGHWVTAVWVAAIWQRGCPVAERDDCDAALAVVGPASGIRGPVTVMCSLHPLGLDLPDLPADCTDYADVLAEPDTHWEEPVPPDAPAWLPDITCAGVERLPGSDRRLLFTDPPPGWESVRMLLVSPVLGGGSTVVVTGAPPERISRIASEEKALLTRVGEAP
ncbi:TIGR03089 family protein [[Pseudopropionibacterium] massiliense]|uniref:TIGR03089 family protein n=1 Tax=[Pseudopropionibacterium] massiliense TaxID=2220000 RepID=UPI0010321683|nr:TIGR03089 family protein [[Pseudopropionibacterium] massiliense]